MRQEKPVELQNKSKHKRKTYKFIYNLFYICCVQFLLLYIYMYAFFEVAVSVCLPRGGCISLPFLEVAVSVATSFVFQMLRSVAPSICVLFLPKSHPALLPPAAWSTLVASHRIPCASFVFEQIGPSSFRFRHRAEPMYELILAMSQGSLFGP